MSDGGGRIGLVDGSAENDSRTFQVVLDPEVVIQLDELVAVATDLPDGRQVTHYGIVTEMRSRFEGADLPSDTGRVVDRTLPAEHVRRAEVRVLRVVPELFVAPHAGAAATRAVGAHRTASLFEDEMTRGKLPVAWIWAALRSTPTCASSTAAPAATSRSPASRASPPRPPMRSSSSTSSWRPSRHGPAGRPGRT